MPALQLMDLISLLFTPGTNSIVTLYAVQEENHTKDKVDIKGHLKN